MAEHPNPALDDFRKLLLSVPLESTKYSFMSTFLDGVLNLTNENDILNPAELYASPQDRVFEIIPQIAVPPDLWTKNGITIKSIKIKKVLLKNVNALLYQFLEALNNEELFLVEEQAILDFEKQVDDFKLLEFQEEEEEQESRFGSLKEDQEDYDDDIPSPNLNLPVTNSSDVMSSSSTAVSNSIKSSHRLSSFSRELMSGRRRKSQLNLNNPKINIPAENGKEKPQFYSPPQSPVLQAPVTPTLAPKGSQLNSLLSKSKIYKQIQKRRELGALINSSNSLTSSNPQRHTSASLDQQESFSFTNRRVSQNAASQKAENQRDKYEYYVQARALADIITLLVGFIGKSGSRANLKRVMEFIKSSIFKFIVVDIAHMIIQRGNFKASNGGFKT